MLYKVFPFIKLLFDGSKFTLLLEGLNFALINLELNIKELVIPLDKLLDLLLAYDVDAGTSHGVTSQVTGVIWLLCIFNISLDFKLFLLLNFYFKK